MTQLVKLTIGFVAVFVLCCGQEKDAALARKEASIRELLSLTDAQKVGDQVFQSMMSAFASKEDAEFGAVMESVRKRIDWNALTELMVPIYSKHFTQEEIDAIVAFYKSPAGRKMVEKLPVIVQEYMPAVMEWRQKVETIVTEELDKKK